jgi:protein TonB
MSLSITMRDPHPEQPRDGLGAALALHGGLAAILIAAAYLHSSHKQTWGENAASVGAIQASMVSSIPLPPKATPVKNSVLTSEDVTPAPQPPPKEAAVPPPKPTDVLIKAKTPDKPVTKVAPVETPAPPKHPQPVPDTPKANSGDAATQLPQSTSQVKNGTATVTVENRTFGNRYAYYLRIVGSTVNQNYFVGEVDPRASQDKSVTVVFDIERDGSTANLRIENRSGSPTLDTAAMRAIQRIDHFSPLPEGDHITIEYKFDFHQP